MAFKSSMISVLKVSNGEVMKHCCCTILIFLVLLTTCGRGQVATVNESGQPPTFDSDSPETVVQLYLEGCASGDRARALEQFSDAARRAFAMHV